MNKQNLPRYRKMYTEFFSRQINGSLAPSPPTSFCDSARCHYELLHFSRYRVQWGNYYSVQAEQGFCGENTFPMYYL